MRILLIRYKDIRFPVISFVCLFTHLRLTFRGTDLINHTEKRKFSLFMRERSIHDRLDVGILSEAFNFVLRSYQ